MIRVKKEQVTRLQLFRRPDEIQSILRQDTRPNVDHLKRLRAVKPDLLLGEVADQVHNIHGELSDPGLPTWNPDNYTKTTHFSPIALMKVKAFG